MDIFKDLVGQLVLAAVNGSLQVIDAPSGYNLNGTAEVVEITDVTQPTTTGSGSGSGTGSGNSGPLNNPVDDDSSPIIAILAILGGVFIIGSILGVGIYKYFRSDDADTIGDKMIHNPVAVGGIQLSAVTATHDTDHGIAVAGDAVSLTDDHA